MDNSLKIKIATVKLYLDKGKNHFGTVQMPLTVLVALGVYRDTAIGRFVFEYEYITIPSIILVFFVALILVGRFEYKNGLIEKQFDVDNANNKMLQQVLGEIEEIKDRISPK